MTLAHLGKGREFEFVSVRVCVSQCLNLCFGVILMCFCLSVSVCDVGIYDND